MRDERAIRDAVREGYAQIARETDAGAGCCGPSASCCGGGAVESARRFGYTEEEINTVGDGANLGLGCGNPTAIASLAPGETVLDLGSGAGFDCFVAARRVGDKGLVIGVDMTPEMLSRARGNADKLGARNVEFRLGEIENLPVADASIDAVISNCVINLSPEKAKVFREIYRVLKPGGRVGVSDMALLRPLPEDVRADLTSYVGCVAGAVSVDEYLGHLRDAGFVDVAVEVDRAADPMKDTQDRLYQRVSDRLPSGTAPGDFVASVRVTARRPPAA